MVYYEQRPDDAEKPPGCLDALIITRAVFGVLLWPFLGLLLVVIDIAAIFWLFTIWAPLALLPIVVAIALIALFARWEQHRYRPPGV